MSQAPQPLTPVESNDPMVVPKRVAMVRPETRPTLRRREEKWVMTFPHLIIREVIMFMMVVIGLAVIALLFNAPLEGLANPLETPNPSKAPWYFLGLQELLHYFPPVVAGVVIPGLVVTALVVIPYARINLVAGPLWSGDRKRLTAGIAAVTAVLVVLFSAFQCWAIVVPSVIVAAAMFLARSEGAGSPFRRFLALVTLPEWIMTWFVLVAAILTIIGTFFRGPGWSLVWPWNMYPPA
jgi:quinol-cytochrome oxidoreductase complex cytochrome b subunit